ncbi:MAG: hypothetical protein P4L51_27885 [Puia sp.]|nr:hypothetical protein [Puia sp.]
MKLAYIIFDGITWLDFMGRYDPVSRLVFMDYLPDLSWDVCTFSETVNDPFGLGFAPAKGRSSLAGYDAIFVPGGQGTRSLVSNGAFPE